MKEGLPAKNYLANIQKSRKGERKETRKQRKSREAKKRITRSRVCCGMN